LSVTAVPNRDIRRIRLETGSIAIDSLSDKELMYIREEPESTRQNSQVSYFVPVVAEITPQVLPEISGWYAGHAGRSRDQGMPAVLTCRHRPGRRLTLKAGIVKDSVRKTLRDRRIALAEFVHAVRE
jgi:hypothetical protein